ncbi:MAG: hypothetical protein ACTHU0_11000 [Kofleriaceae bacterium]
MSESTTHNAAAIEEAITRLVQEAPEIDGALVDELVERLVRVGSPLALALRRIVELVAEGLVDPGIALPALAMACATLAGGVRGEFGERELEAARYEIDTLLPMPAPARIVTPDVPASALTRGPRRRP